MKILISILMVLTINSFLSQLTEIKAYSNVSSFFKTIYGKTYRGYQFGYLYEITPSEINTLNNLKINRKELKNTDSIMLFDSLIIDIQEKIDINKLSIIYETSHFFTLKKDYSDKGVLYEYKVNMSPSGEIIDTIKIMELNLICDDYTFYHAYFKYNFALTNDTGKLNKHYYYHFNELYKKEVINKDAVMQAILSSVRVLKSSQYDVYKIAKNQAKKEVSKRLGTICASTAYGFSELKEIKDSSKKEVIGYSFYVKYDQWNEKTELFRAKMFHIIMDLDLIVLKVSPFHKEENIIWYD